jgi:Flp pilus assembly protein TadD
VHRFSAALLVCCLSWASPATARDIHYGAVNDAELLRCDRLHWAGQLPDADGCYRGVLGASTRAAIKAEAAWALGDHQLANDLFRTAAQESPDDASLRVRWGDLFADSHQDGEAMNIYREALTLDPDNAFATLGAAKVLVGGFDDAANTYLEPLLSDSTRDAGARAAAWLVV